MNRMHIAIAIAILQGLMGCAGNNHKIPPSTGIMAQVDDTEGINHSYLRKNHSQQVMSNVPNTIQHAITSSDTELRYDKFSISPIIMNPKDGMPDLPDSVWDRYIISPLSIYAKKDNIAAFIYSSPNSFPYAYAKPIMRSLTEVGVRWIYIPIGINKYSAVEMINSREDEYVVHSADSTGYNSIIQIHPDSILLFVNSEAKNGNLVLGLPIKNQKRFDSTEMLQLKSTLVKELALKNCLQWVGIDPHPSIPFEKLVQILTMINNINETSALKTGINVTLHGIYVPWD